jgi:hypothetical protein
VADADALAAGGAGADHAPPVDPYLHREFVDVAFLDPLVSRLGVGDADLDLGAAAHHVDLFCERVEAGARRVVVKQLQVGLGGVFEAERAQLHALGLGPILLPGMQCQL